MAQSMYKIALVERGYEEQWRGFWVRNENDEKVKAAHRAGKLGQTEEIVASNLSEAKAKVRQQRPDCTIMDEGCARLSSVG